MKYMKYGITIKLQSVVQLLSINKSVYSITTRKGSTNVYLTIGRFSKHKYQA